MTASYRTCSGIYKKHALPQSCRFRSFAVGSIFFHFSCNHILYLRTMNTVLSPVLCHLISFKIELRLFGMCPVVFLHIFGAFAVTVLQNLCPCLPVLVLLRNHLPFCMGKMTQRFIPRINASRQTFGFIHLQNNSEARVSSMVDRHVELLSL